MLTNLQSAAYRLLGCAATTTLLLQMRYSIAKLSLLLVLFCSMGVALAQTQDTYYVTDEVQYNQDLWSNSTTAYPVTTSTGNFSLGFTCVNGGATVNVVQTYINMSVPLPANAVVTLARLRIHATSHHTGVTQASGNGFKAQRVISAWKPSTFNASAPPAVSTINEANSTPLGNNHYEFDVTSIVQAAVAGANFQGFKLSGTNNCIWSSISNGSDPNTGWRPRLIITYTIPNCNGVQQAWSHNVQNTSAVVKWLPVAGATGYKLQYKVAGNIGWNTAWKYTNIGHKLLNNLQPNTTYRYRLQSVCSSGNSVWTPIQTFTTLSAPCLAPTGLQTSPVGQHQAKAIWSGAVGAVSYQLRYRPSGGNWTFKSKSGSSGHHWLTGLSTSTTYEWQIRTLCQFGPAPGTPWSVQQTFTTAASAKTDQLRSVETSATANGPMELRLWPNPAQAHINLAWQGTAGSSSGQAVIFDLTGQRVATYQFSTQGQHSAKLELGTALARGVYLMRVKIGDNSFSRRLILQ